MLKFKITIIVLILAAQCRTNGFAEMLFPFFSTPIRTMNKFLTQNPGIQPISDLTGDAIALVSRPITDLNLAIGRLGINQMQFPVLFHHNIGRHFQEENFLQQFKAGTYKEDSYLHIVKLVAKYGYAIEEHTVKTSDGYILTMYRMPPRKQSQNASAVLLMHGLLASADDFVVTGPGHGLAYLLADRGYDVWLGNARGNVHSRHHSSISPDEAAFWDFSWHEIGQYDLPAMIDYILLNIGKKKVHYVGHSQGTTAFFVMCSERPEYNEKIEMMSALSPVAWMSHAVSPVVRLMAGNTNLIRSFLVNAGVNELLPNDVLIKSMGQLLCEDTSLTQILCGNFLFLIGGFSLEQLNSTTLPVILGHVPAGASVNQLVHYGQGIVSEEFRQFDHGPEENLRRYNSYIPPRYNVEKITAPIALLYSEKDWLASVEDVNVLTQLLPNVVELYKIPRVQFSHLDFLWGIDARELAFKKVVDLMEANSKKLSSRL